MAPGAPGPGPAVTAVSAISAVSAGEGRALVRALLRVPPVCVGGAALAAVLVMRGFGAPPEVAAAGALHLRCLAMAMAVAMAGQCAALGLLYRRTPSPQETGTALARSA